MPLSVQILKMSPEAIHAFIDQISPGRLGSSGEPVGDPTGEDHRFIRCIFLVRIRYPVPGISGNEMNILSPEFGIMPGRTQA